MWEGLRGVYVGVQLGSVKQQRTRNFLESVVFMMFEAAKKTVKRNIVIKAQRHIVQPMFTPEGETKWLPGWKYESIRSDNGETVLGSIFRTNHPVEGSAVWICTEMGINAVEYVRVAVENLVCKLRIEFGVCNGDLYTEAKIQFDFTGLTDKGNELILQYSAGLIENYIDTWADYLNEYFQLKY